MSQHWHPRQSGLPHQRSTHFLDTRQWTPNSTAVSPTAPPAASAHCRVVNTITSVLQDMARPVQPLLKPCSLLIQ
ncbi:hypothetical protein M9458_004741, partial [Cirrhinus mrigala]